MFKCQTYIIEWFYIIFAVALIMSSFRLTLNVDQANKLNRMLPRGYKLVSYEQHRKRRLAQSKKKSKIVYVPVQQVNKPAIHSRRKSAPQYYNQGSQYNDTKYVYYDYQQKKQVNNLSLEKASIKASSSQPIYSYVPPPIQPQNQQRAPYTPKQIIQKIKSHPKFYVILQFRDDFSQSNFDIIVSKCQGTFYSLNELQADLHKIFFKIYESYSKSMPIYNDAAYLENYINTLINAEKARLKESQKEELQMDESVRALNRKKTQPPKLNEVKNITIMDKRVLGQNIKKLAPECLPEIVRIVFDTIETRQEYQINIDTLPLKKLKELQTYVSGCLQKQGLFDQQIKHDGESSESSFVIQDDFD